MKIASLKQPDKYFNLVIRIFTLRVWIFFVVSSIACIIILKYILEQSVSLAALDFARMLVSASTLKSPRTSHGKIFLITLVIAIFGLSTFLLDCLSAVTTVPDRAFCIETVEDLVKSNITIYGPASLKDLVWSEIHDRYIKITEYKECFDSLVSGNRIACIGEHGHLRYNLYENSTIHISKSDVISRAAALIFSEDSPIRHKFESILLRMNQGGFTKLLLLREEMLYAKNLDTADDFKAFDVEALSCVFSILTGGWALAVILISSELIIDKVKKSNFRILKNNKILYHVNTLCLNIKNSLRS